MYTIFMKTFTLKRIILLLIIVIIIIFIFSFFEGKLKNEIQKNFSGVKEFLWSIGTSKEKSPAYIEAKDDFKIAEIASLKEENEFLREILGISIEKDYKFEIASVTGKNSFEDVLTINKGLKDGVQDNMAVLTSEKALIGKILKAYDDYSEVMLLSNKDSAIDIKIVSTKDYAIAKGGSEKVLLDYLEKESEVKEGDICITSSLGGQFKEGLLVGKIVKINDLGSEVFKTGEIRPFFTLKDLDKVLIVKE